MNSRKTILVLFPDEINACIAQFPWLAKDAIWLCLTIDALDRCLQLNIPKALMPSWLQADGTFSVEEHQKLFSKLQDLEEYFLDQRKSMGFNENSYWNHQHNFRLLTLLLSAQKTAALAVDNLDKSSEFIILQRMGIGDYNFPSGLLAAIIRDKLQRENYKIETIYLPATELVSAYSSNVYTKIPNYWSHEVSSHWQKSTPNIIISPSGVFYKSDQNKLLKLLKKLGVTSKTWMLSPPFWNVIPDGSGFKDRISVKSAFENLSTSMQMVLKVMVDNMTASTDKIMQDILGDEIVELDVYKNQIQRIKERYFFQCLTFLGMAHLCSVKPMEAMIVSNLDGGINGPLFSVAQDNSSHCYMLPHSHVINQYSEGLCTAITEYWQPKPPMSFRGESNFTIHLSTDTNLENTVDFWNEPRQKKILIIFNGIHKWTSLNAGLKFFKEILRDIEEACMKEGYELAYRLKPGDQTPLDAYCQLLEIDRNDCQNNLGEPLDVLLKDTELVIALDDPSSALWEAVEHGCAVIVITNRPFIRSTLIDENVLESYSPERGVELITQMLSDKNLLDQMRLTQFSKLLALRESRLSI